MMLSSHVSPQLMVGAGTAGLAQVHLTAAGSAGRGLIMRILRAVQGSGQATSIGGVFYCDLDVRGRADLSAQIAALSQTDAGFRDLVFEMLPSSRFGQGLGGNLITALNTKRVWAPLVDRAANRFHERLLTSSLAHRRDQATTVLTVISTGGHFELGLHLLDLLFASQPSALHIIAFVISASERVRRRLLARAWCSLRERVERGRQHGITTLILAMDNGRDVESNDRGLAALMAAVSNTAGYAFQDGTWNTLSQLSADLGAGGGLPLATIAAATAPVGLHKYRPRFFSAERTIVDWVQASTAAEDVLTRVLESEDTRALKCSVDADRYSELTYVLTPSDEVEELHGALAQSFPELNLMLTAGYIDGGPVAAVGGGQRSSVTAVRLIPADRSDVERLIPSERPGVERIVSSFLGERSRYGSPSVSQTDIMA